MEARIQGVLGAVAAMCVVLWSPFVVGQFAVTDPGNLFQNVTQVIQQIDQIRNQVKQIENQVRQVEYMAQNLKRLEANDYQSLRNSFYALDRSYRQAKHIGMRWGRVAEQYDAHYEEFDPKVHDGRDYEERRRQWSEQTDDSIRTAMVSHGVMDGYAERNAGLDRLVEASNNAEGTLAAIQAGNQISGLILKQLMELQAVIVADSRARLSHMKEQQMKEEASRARGKEALMRDYGKPAGPKPSTSEELPEIK